MIQSSCRFQAHRAIVDRMDRAPPVRSSRGLNRSLVHTDRTAARRQPTRPSRAPGTKTSTQTIPLAENTTGSGPIEHHGSWSCVKPLIQQFLPHLKTRKEAPIVNVSSGLAFIPFPASPVYCATKAVSLGDEEKAKRDGTPQDSMIESTRFG